ncbi:hypothetical protein [Luteimicrobium album]|nr:hypothetical protein [Luteimicrobium album]
MTTDKTTIDGAVPSPPEVTPGRSSPRTAVRGVTARAATSSR